jgi:hypothetical protein
MAEYERIKNNYLDLQIPAIKDGGWDGNAKLLLEEQGDNDIGYLYYAANNNTDYFVHVGAYCLFFDQHYVAMFEVAGPVAKMNELQARNYYSEAKDCLTRVLNKKDSKFWGRVTNAWGKELPGMVINLTYDGKEYETTTDENGTYRIPFEGPWGRKAQMSFMMQCRDDELRKVFFTITPEHDNDAPYTFDLNFTVREENDLQQDFIAKNDLQGSEFMGYIYYKMIQAITVYVSECGEEEFSSRMQEVIIRPYAENKHSFYLEDSNSIIISNRDTVYTDYVGLFRPTELEFHEYSHHVMKSYYLEIPRPPADVLIEETNHGGYINPSTADSFVEGFAMFMAQIIREKAGYKYAGIDSMFGSLELNTRAWDGNGYSEDMAVAGIFWDLYDGIDAADDDPVQFTLQEMWGVLKNYKGNMYEVYQKYVNDFPDRKPDIDRIFLNHGFFADTDKGNGTYDPGEPTRGRPDLRDEYFIDLANPVVWDNKKKDGQVLDEKETVGQATNYQRPDRYYPPPRPLEFIKTNDTYPFYKVTVSFPENPALNYELIAELQEDGLIPVAMPPDSYQAAITVEGYGEGVTTGAPLTFTNGDYTALYAAVMERGYYEEHDFQITGAAPARPKTDPAFTSPGSDGCVASRLLGNNDKRLDTLRLFRDNVLAKSTIGKQCINMYYKHGKKLIAAIEHRPSLQAAVRIILRKLIPATDKKQPA